MHWFKNWINIIFHQSLISYDFKVERTDRRTHVQTEKHNSRRYGMITLNKASNYEYAFALSTREPSPVLSWFPLLRSRYKLISHTMVYV